MTQYELECYLRHIDTIIHFNLMDGLLQYFYEQEIELCNIPKEFYVPINMRRVFWEMTNWMNYIFTIKDYQMVLYLLRKNGPQWMSMKKQVRYDLEFLKKIDEDTYNIVSDVSYTSLLNPYEINRGFYIPSILYEDIEIRH